jgi:hypothetical protein
MHQYLGGGGIRDLVTSVRGTSIRGTLMTISCFPPPKHLIDILFCFK